MLIKMERELFYFLTWANKMRNLTSILFFIFPFSVFAQKDSCDCSLLVPKTFNMDDGRVVYSKNNSGVAYSGICTVYANNIQCEKSVIENGTLLYHLKLFSNGDTLAFYVAHPTDSLFAIETNFFSSVDKIQMKSFIYEKNGIRYKKQIIYTREGTISAIYTYRFKKESGEWTTEKALEGRYLSYGGLYAGTPTTSFPQTEGWYKNNLMDSAWIGKWENGKIKFTGNYKEGLQTGHWINYNSSGVKISEGNYLSGKKEGEWKEWYENGQLKSHATFSNGRISGDVQTYYRDGKKETEFYYRTSTGRTWDESGKLLERDSLIKNSSSKDTATIYIKEFIYANGKKSRQTEEIQGIKNGEEKLWDVNGNLISIFNRKNGKLNGLCTSYYSNGNKLEEIFYTDSIPDGAYKTWYENGQAREDFYFTNNVRNGRFRKWTKDGNLYFDRTYKMGKSIDFVIPEQPIAKNNFIYRIDSVFAQSDSLITAFRLDAMIFAAQSVLDSSSPYFDSIIIPEKLINKFLLTQIAFYNHTSISEHQYESNGWQNFVTCMAEMKKVTVEYDDDNRSSPTWLEQWENGHEHTGNKIIDEIILKYHLHFLTDNMHNWGGGNISFYFTSPYLINGNALGKALNKAEDRLKCYLGGCGRNYDYVGSRHILFESKGDYFKITEVDGLGGDCPAGCIDKRYTKWYIYEDGEMDLIDQYDNLLRRGYPNH
jgi:antitoxin component YwqK of YwqJK toxin-antitoxin module